MLFFFNDTATTEIYTLSLHDALPISGRAGDVEQEAVRQVERDGGRVAPAPVGDSLEKRPVGLRIGLRDAEARMARQRSEEHTSELQSRQYLVCRLLLEKKNTTKQDNH